MDLIMGFDGKQQHLVGQVEESIGCLGKLARVTNQSPGTLGLLRSVHTACRGHMCLLYMHVDTVFSERTVHKMLTCRKGGAVQADRVRREANSEG